MIVGLELGMGWNGKVGTRSGVKVAELELGYGNKDVGWEWDERNGTYTKMNHKLEKMYGLNNVEMWL